MALTFELYQDNVQMNHYAKYLGQRLFTSEVNCPNTHKYQTDFFTKPLKM